MTDIDQWVKEYKHAIQTQTPTIASPNVTRNVPIRAPSIRADVGVAFAWAMGSAFFIFVLLGIYALLNDGSGWVALFWAFVVATIVWFLLMLDWKSLILAIEEETHDLNGENAIGYISPPATHYSLPAGPGSFKFGEVDIEPALLIEWCQAAWERRSLAISTWQDRFCLPDGTRGRIRYEAFRDWLVTQGYAETVGGNVGLRPCWNNQEAVTFIGGFAQANPAEGTPLLEQ